jgi:hypothetical protein
MRNGRRTLLLLIVVLFVLIAVATLQTQQMTTSEPTPSVSYLRVFPELAVLDIGALRLHEPTSGATFDLVRGEEGAWTSPSHAGELDAEAASSIARTLVLLPYSRTIPLPDTFDLRDYGLAPNGSLMIQVLTTEGDAHVIAVGGLAPSQAAYYALVDELPDLFVLERPAVDYLITQVRNPPVS